MNDQGKCLRGEGICATQKSQQCMLKKIFEGMWGLHEAIFAREYINRVLMGSSVVGGGGLSRDQAVVPRNLEIQENLLYPFKN